MIPPITMPRIDRIGKTALEVSLRPLTASASRAREPRSDVREELDARHRHVELERELVSPSLDPATELGDGLAVGVSETAMDVSSITPASTVPSATSVTPIGCASTSSTTPGPRVAGSRARNGSATLVERPRALRVQQEGVAHVLERDVLAVVEWLAGRPDPLPAPAPRPEQERELREILVEGGRVAIALPADPPLSGRRACIGPTLPRA